jgi:PilM.
MTIGQVITLIAFLIMITTVSSLNGLFDNKQEQNAVSQIDSLANQMSSYRGYASAYLRSNPTKTGVVTDSDLNLPDWFSGRDIRIKNYFTSGKAYVYCTSGCQGGVEARLKEITQQSLSVGHANNGKFNVNGVDVAGISLPAVIQNGDVVYMVLN